MATFPTLAAAIAFLHNAYDLEASDAFSRADSTTTMGQSDSGQMWQPLLGQWGIKTNAAYLAGQDSFANLLSANTADIETDTSGWAAVSGITSLAQSTVQAHTGTHSLLVTFNGGAQPGITTPTGTNGIPVLASIPYTFYFWARAVSTTSSTWRTQIFWYKSDGTASSTPSNTGTTFADSSSAWNQSPILTATSPSDAAFAAVVISNSGTPANGTQHYFDTMSFQAASSVLAATPFVSGYTAGGYSWNLSVVTAAAVGTVQTTLTGIQDGAGVVGRCSDINNYWRLSADTVNSRYDLIKRVAGVDTQAATLAVTPTANDVLSIQFGESVGLNVNTIKATVNSTSATITDSFNATAFRVGICTGVNPGAARFTTFSHSFLWTDITGYVKYRPEAGPHIRRGKNYELDATQVGTMTMMLANYDRRFEPGYTGGAYTPYVVPMKRVRLQATWNSVTYNLFTGYVERWPNKRTDGGTTSTIELACQDALAQFAQIRGANVQSAYAAQVLRNGCRALWSGAYPNPGAPADLSPNNFVSTAAGGTAGTSLIAHDPPLMQDLTNPGVPLEADAAPPPGPSNWMVEFLFKSTRTDSSVHTMLSWRPSADNTKLVAIGLEFNNPSSTSKVHIWRNGSDHVSGTLTLNDGLVHHVLASWNGQYLDLFVDGAHDYQVSSVPIDGGTPNQLTWWEDISATTGWTTYNDQVQYMTVYDYSDVPLGAALTSNTATTDSALITATFQLPTGAPGVMIGQILDLIRWPKNKRSLDTGGVESSYAYTGFNLDSTTTILTLLNRAPDLDDGYLFMDAGGSVNLRGKEGLWGQAAPANTFGDRGNGTDMPYLDPVLPEDLDQTFNDLLYTPSGGTAVRAVNDSSVRNYLPRALQKTVYNTTAIINWVLGRKATPQSRLEQMTILPWGTAIGGAAWWDKVLGIDLGTRQTVVATPPSDYVAVTYNVMLIGIEHLNVGSNNWSIRYRMVPMPPQGKNLWILDDATFSVLDTSTVPG